MKPERRNRLAIGYQSESQTDRNDNRTTNLTALPCRQENDWQPSMLSSVIPPAKMRMNRANRPPFMPTEHGSCTPPVMQREGDLRLRGRIQGDPVPIHERAASLPHLARPLPPGRKE